MLPGNQGSGSSNNLDAMLGNLNTDMSKQGVTIVAKGNCAACNNPIVGQVEPTSNPICGLKRPASTEIQLGMVI